MCLPPLDQLSPKQVNSQSAGNHCECTPTHLIYKRPIVPPPLSHTSWKHLLETPTRFAPSNFHAFTCIHVYLRHTRTYLQDNLFRHKASKRNKLSTSQFNSKFGAVVYTAAIWVVGTHFASDVLQIWCCVHVLRRENCVSSRWQSTYKLLFLGTRQLGCRPCCYVSAARLQRREFCCLHCQPEKQACAGMLANSVGFHSLHDTGLCECLPTAKPSVSYILQIVVNTSKMCVTIQLALWCQPSWAIEPLWPISTSRFCEHYEVDSWLKCARKFVSLGHLTAPSVGCEPGYFLSTCDVASGAIYGYIYRHLRNLKDRKMRGFAFFLACLLFSQLLACRDDACCRGYPPYSRFQAPSQSSYKILQCLCCV